MSLAAETREAVRTHPFLLDALRAGVVNYNAAAAWLVTPAPLGDGIYVAVFATLGAVAIIALHHGNIRRLLRGEEDRIGGD